MAKRTARRTAAKELERRDLVVAVRTLVAMASCWLDRDPEARGVDDKQSATLREVVSTLAKAAAAQQVHARQILALLYRDEVAIAKASKTSIDEKCRTFLEDRKRRHPHLPNQVLGEWVSNYHGYLDPNPVVTALRAGFFTFTLLGEGEGRNIDLELAQDYATQLDELFADGHGPVQSANVVVFEVLGENAKHGQAEWTVGGSSEGGGAGEADGKVKSTEKRMSRALEGNRHRDQNAIADAVDLGEFFGARKSQSAGPNPREAAAIELLASAAGMRREPDGTLREANNSGPWTWSTAARGLVDLNSQEVSAVSDPRPSDADGDPLGP